jgi:hypothetical protein
VVFEVLLEFKNLALGQVADCRALHYQPRSDFENSKNLDLTTETSL